MADFKTKLLTLASVAAVFTGIAHAQVAGCTASSNAVFVAAEGTTEQVSDVTISCPAQGNALATTVNLSVYLSPAVSITSATLGSGGSARSETEAGLTGAFATSAAGAGGQGSVGANATPANSVQAGVVSGSSITFNGIVIPANTASSFTITNIKINASQIATSSGAPTAVTETIFISGTNVTPAVLSAVNVAFATNALSGIYTSGAVASGTSIGGIPICSGQTAFGDNLTTAQFFVGFGEGFSTAFKTQGTAAGNSTLGSEFTANTYTGYGVTTPAANTATSGTRVQIVFNNIPANVNLYVPLVIHDQGGSAGTMTLTASATGALSAVAGSTANGAPGASANNTSVSGGSTFGLLTASSGSATAVYEETTNAFGSVENYVVPVGVQVGAAVVPAPASAITATVSFGPIGATSNVPNFVSGSSTATKNGNAFTACTTTLLFPFVTNQLGFDTGLAIANTSNDLLATKNGSPVSQAVNQSGTCQLNFFGSSAPTTPYTSSSIASGSTFTSAASTLAPGFQGYVTAVCNFQYAHAFAYVVYNLTQSNGAAMGYLGLVIPGSRSAAESLNN